MKQFSINILVFFLVMQIVGCGGGGGSDDSTPPPANLAPSANAGTDQTVNEQTTVTLSGSGADSDGTIISYLWEQIDNGAPTVSITNDTNASASFEAPNITEQLTITLRLTVTDDDNATSTDTVDIVVNPVTSITLP